MSQAFVNGYMKAADELAAGRTANLYPPDTDEYAGFEEGLIDFAPGGINGPHSRGPTHEAR